MTVPPRLEEGVTLASLTTLQVGGPIRFLARCRDLAELGEARRWAQSSNLRTFALGGGSNVLAADRGFDGLVIQWLDDSIDIEARGEQVLVQAGAGVEWDALVERAVAEGFAGLECLSGIPGRVGAAPMQNIGAYGQEVAETIESVRVVELATGAPRRVTADECGFAYRTSRFKQAWRGRYLITGVDFLLPRSALGRVRYPDLLSRFAMREDGAPSPSLAEVRRAVLDIRRSKSMVIDTADPNHRSAGSFFTNPIVAPEVAAKIRHRVSRQMPAWPAGGGRVKLSAAWLIEAAGFNRGERFGRAGLSTRHSLALINRGGATAEDVIGLAAKVRRQVRQVLGVGLDPEPIFLGFDQDAETLLR